MTTPPARTLRSNRRKRRTLGVVRSIPPPRAVKRGAENQEAKAREERKTKDGTTHDGAEPVDSLLLAQRL
jgi:hypothetical protein